MGNHAETITKIIQSIFKEEVHPASYGVELKDLPNFDSMRYIELISILEKTFEVKLSFNDIISLKTVEDIINCIDKLAKS